MRAHHALRRWGSGVLAALLVCGWTLAFAGCAPSGATSTAPPAPSFSAVDVSMDSPTDGWAVGDRVAPAIAPNTEPTVMTAMAHYQRGRWRLAPASVTGDLGPNQSFRLVRMLSPTDGWAVTSSSFVHYGDDLYHYDGAQWRLAYPPAGALTRTINVADLELSSPESGWAVGADGILQYMHGAWANVTTSLPPPPADWESKWPYPGLRSVSIASPTDAWAMGDGGVIWHYDGDAWRLTASPYFPNRYYASASLNGYSASATDLALFTQLGHTRAAFAASQMLTTTQGWAVGGAIATQALSEWGPAVVEQYQGGAWQVVHIVPTHVPGQNGPPVFLTVALSSPQEGWIGGAWGRSAPGGTGDQPKPDHPVYAPLLLHEHAGQWSFVSAPTTGAIHRLVMLSADDGWAASDGGLLHYTGGQWRLVSVLPAS